MAQNKKKLKTEDWHNWIWRSLQANRVDCDDLTLEEALEIVIILKATLRTIGFEDYCKMVKEIKHKHEDDMDRADTEGTVQLYDSKGRPAGRMDPIAFISRFTPVEMGNPMVKSKGTK